MFTVDPNITELNLKKKTIAKLFFSMNVHQVATPEMMLEDAKSYVLFFREGKERFSAYIALHLLSTSRSLYYSHSDNAFLEKEMDGVMDDAFAFAESLGAMLDEINFSKMSEEEQNTWIDEQDIFSQKKPAETRPAPQPEITEEAQPAAPVEQPTPAPVQPQAEAQPAISATQPAPAPPQVEAQPAALAPPHPAKEPAALPQQPTQVPPVAAPVQEISVPEPQQPVQATYAPVIVVQEPSVPEPQKPVQPQQETSIVSPLPQAPQVQKAPSAPPSRQTAQAPQQPARPKPLQESKQRPKPSIEKLQEELKYQVIKAGIAKPPEKEQTGEQRQVAGLVSRDREALARLLTSF